MNSHNHISKTPDPWRPGSWEPGRLNLVDSIALTGALAFLAFIRGFDYLTPKSSQVPPSPALSAIEQAFPLWVWGLGFAVPAILLALFTVLRIHRGVWFGHWILAVVYFALVVGLGGEYITRPWFDGIRSATAMALPMGLHILIAVRTGWRPPLWIPAP